MTETVTEIKDAQVYLTKGQCEYIAGTDHEGDRVLLDPIDTVITMVSTDGWIFVEQAECVGEEGSGVWVDAAGREHFGPTGRSGSGPTDDDTYSDDAKMYYRGVKASPA